MEPSNQTTPEIVKADIRIWGGPGSGKTSHSCSLIQSYGIKPEEICALTLRKNMAEDLARKLIDTGIADSYEELPLVATMHAVIRRWLNFSSENSIYGDEKAGTPNMQAEFFKEKKIPFSKNGEDVFKTIPDKLGNLFLALRTWVIHTMHVPEDWGKAPLASDFRRHGGNHKLFMRLWQDYDDFKKDNDLWDFDDLIQVSLQKDSAPPVKLLFCDEAQDNTLAMHNILARWSREIPVRIVAGDPNQSLYGFLGGDPDLFWNYTTPRKEIVLPVCYRIPKNTWKLAESILKVSGHPIPEFRFEKDTGVIRRISAHKLMDILKHHPWPAFHLIRANFQREKIAEYLINAGRPFKGYSSKWTDKDLDLYNAIFEIRQHAEEGFQSEMIIPSEYLKRLAEVFPKQFFSCKKKDIGENQYEWREIHSVLKATLISKLMGPDPLTHVLKNGLTETQRLKVTQALRYNNKPLSKADFHQIMTIHGSKGLQTETVFLYSEWTRKIKRESDFREEARVWYVGSTRHKHMLFIVDGLFSDYPACEPCPILGRWKP